MFFLKAQEGTRKGNTLFNLIVLFRANGVVLCSYFEWFWNPHFWHPFIWTHLSICHLTCLLTHALSVKKQLPQSDGDRSFTKLTKNQICTLFSTIWSIRHFSQTKTFKSIRISGKINVFKYDLKHDSSNNLTQPGLDINIRFIFLFDWLLL